MHLEMNGHDCEFELTCASKLKLYRLGFAARRCTKTEKFLHSFMMEALGMSYTIQHWCPFLWGQPFTLIIDCSVIKWIMTNDGDNAAAQRL